MLGRGMLAGDELGYRRQRHHRGRLSHSELGRVQQCRAAGGLLPPGLPGGARVHAGGRARVILAPQAILGGLLRWVGGGTGKEGGHRTALRQSRRQSKAS
eukprot:1185960-Prorocentrum_minimum.AAC.3